MRRRRYHRSYRRPPKDYVWQRKSVSHPDVTVTSDTIFTVNTVMVPGVQQGETVRPFEEPVTLERIRGMVAHNVNTGSPSNSDPLQVFPANWAAQKIPAGIAEGFTNTEDITDLEFNLDGDDYFLYMSMLCGLDVHEITGVEKVDSKAKRKFPVGDLVVITFQIPAISFTGTLSMNYAFNLSFLWKIGN